MKVLLINGSPNEKGCTYTALCEVAEKLHEHGIETELWQVGRGPIAGCIDCDACFKTHRCVFDDLVNEIAAKIDEYDGLVVGSPVYYAGPAGQLCALLDRLFQVTGRRMAGKVGACVVSCRRGGASAAFDRLNKYFTITNMVVASSQYWNQVHGSTPEEVLRDVEGLQTMRTLAENMAWLMKSIKAGREAGLTPPQYERRIYTNFIRE